MLAVGDIADCDSHGDEATAALVDLLLAGHAHNYERFAPQEPNGNLAPDKGIRQIVVGTGGKNHQDYEENILPNSIMRNSDTYGVLRLNLYASAYEWEFIPIAGFSFTDTGRAACH